MIIEGYILKIGWVGELLLDFTSGRAKDHHDREFFFSPSLLPFFIFNLF